MGKRLNPWEEVKEEFANWTRKRESEKGKERGAGLSIGQCARWSKRVQGVVRKPPEGMLKRKRG